MTTDLFERDLGDEVLEKILEPHQRMAESAVHRLLVPCPQCKEDVIINITMDRTSDCKHGHGRQVSCSGCGHAWMACIRCGEQSGLAPGDPEFLNNLEPLSETELEDLKRHIMKGGGLR